MVVTSYYDFTDEHSAVFPPADQMRRDLETLRFNFERESWQYGREPLIGDPDCPVLAEAYGERGRSCYVVFVYKKVDGTYGCKHKPCFRDGDDRGPSFRLPEDAIRHQRDYHF
jgi:hypothetical protein